MVLRDKTNDHTSANVDNMKQWLEGMVEELGNEAAASVIAATFMDTLKSQGANVEFLALTAVAVDQSLTEDLRKLEEEQDGNVPLDEDEEYDEVEPEFAADEPDEAAPAVAIAPKEVTPVNYRRGIYRFNRYNANIRVKERTGKTNLYRSIRKLEQALDYCGTLEHQMFVIHRVLTKGPRAGIGLGLGLLESRIADDRARQNTILLLMIYYILRKSLWMTAGPKPTTQKRS